MASYDTIRVVDKDGVGPAEALEAVCELTLRRDPQACVCDVPASALLRSKRGLWRGTRVCATIRRFAHARELIDSGMETRAAVAALFGVDVATLRRALRAEPVD